MPEFDELNERKDALTDRNAPQKIRGALPTNLAYVTRKCSRWYLFFPAMAVILLLGALFTQYLVIARFQRLDDERKRLRDAQAELEEAEGVLEQYFASRDVYVHVTWSDMDAKETAVVDPLDVAELLERVVLPVSPLDSWSLADNTVKLTVRCGSLEAVNELAKKLREEEMVAYCTVHGGKLESPRADDPGTLGRPGETVSELTIRFRDAQNGHGGRRAAAGG